MCGGFSIISKKNTLIERFHADFNFDYTPVSNARPGQNLPVILAPQRVISLARFGYLPHWLNSSSVTGRLPKPVINARAETISNKPFFKDSFLHRRCLILADSFFEWEKEAGGKRQYRILLKTEEPFAFAGVWDELPDNMLGFAIITVPANSDVLPIHDRMPVILSPDEEEKWLNPNLNQVNAHELLHPSPPGLLQSHPVIKN